MQYTIRDVPDDVDKAIRDRARTRSTSVNQAVVDVLREGLRLDKPLQKKRDLSGIFGKSMPDAAIDKALAECRQIDEEQWR